MNWRVLAFSLGLTLVTGLIFSLLPALMLSRFSLINALQEGGRSAGDSSRRGRLKTGLVVGELALTVLLLLCAGKLIRSFQSYMSVDPGFVPDNVLTMRIVLPAEKYKQSQQWAAYFDGVEREIRMIPEVMLAAVGSGAPMDGYGETSRYNIVGKPVPDGREQQLFADYMRIGRDYFQVAGIKLRKGRYFNDVDVDGKDQIAIVNESFVRRELADKDPIGQRINLLGNVNASVINKSDKPSLEIVGVVADIKEYGVFRSTPPMIYVPMKQDPVRAMSLMIKPMTNDPNLLPEVRSRLLKLDPDQPVYNVSTLENILSGTNALFRFNTILLTAFAGIALTLSLIGVYGVIAYSVGQRTKEFGVKMALGARPADIFKQVLGKAALLSVLGLLFGLVASFPAIKLLAQSTQRSLGTDLIGSGPMLFVVVGGATILVTLLACFVPARRATKVDPMTALRSE